MAFGLSSKSNSNSGRSGGGFGVGRAKRSKSYEEINDLVSREEAIAHPGGCSQCRARRGQACKGLKGGAVHMVRKVDAWKARR